MLLGNQNTPVIILLSRSRSGSNYLKSLLNCQPRICLEGEIFRHLEGAEAAFDFESKIHRKAWTVRGAKLFYYHPIASEDQTIWELIAQSPRIKVIHLQRNSVIRTHVSSLIAQKTGEWQAEKNPTLAEFSKDKRIHVNLDELQDEIAVMKEWRLRALKRCSTRPVFDVTYENLIQAPQAHLDRIFDFLDLPTTRVSSHLIKQNTEPLSKLIENFGEVEAFGRSHGLDLS